MSSTDTEMSDQGPCSKMAKQPVKMNPEISGTKSCGKVIKGHVKRKPMTTSDWATTKFWQTLSQVQAVKRGCKWCSFNCLLHVRAYLDSLTHWREQFRQLSAEAADKELLWIFHSCRDRTSASCPVLPHLQRDQVTHDEDGCTTDTSEVENEKAKPATDSGTSTSNPDGTESDDLQHHVPIKRTRVPVVVANVTRKRPSKRTSTKRPSSLDLAKFLPLTGDERLGVICFRCVLFALGIGQSRYTRVLWQVNYINHLI